LLLLLPAGAVPDSFPFLFSSPLRRLTAAGQSKKRSSNRLNGGWKKKAADEKESPNSKRK
jgi:hypothetical protein